MSEKTIFQKIIDREIPSSIVYEDDIVIAILDIHPINPGHTLVIPKVVVDEFQDLDDETFKHIMSVARRIAVVLKKVFKPTRVGILIAGFDVPHTHVAVIPLEKHEDIPSTQPETPVKISELNKAASKIKSAL